MSSSRISTIVADPSRLRTHTFPLTIPMRFRCSCVAGDAIPSPSYSAGSSAKVIPSRRRLSVIWGMSDGGNKDCRRGGVGRGDVRETGVLVGVNSVVGVLATGGAASTAKGGLVSVSSSNFVGDVGVVVSMVVSMLDGGSALVASVLVVLAASSTWRVSSGVWRV